MWIAFGLIALVLTVGNVLTVKKDGRWVGFLPLVAVSFTLLMLLLLYGIAAEWVVQEDWTALADVLPSMRWLLTGLVAVSLVVNIGSHLIRCLYRQ